MLKHYIHSDASEIEPIVSAVAQFQQPFLKEGHLIYRYKCLIDCQVGQLQLTNSFPA